MEHWVIEFVKNKILFSNKFFIWKKLFIYLLSLFSVHL